jgi:hypothetical protein
MTEPTYEYVVLEMKPNEDPEDMAVRLNRYGVLGFKPLPPVLQGDYVIFTLYREAQG